MQTRNAGATYFVTLECFQRQTLMARPPVKQMMVESIRETKKQFGLRVAAYVVLDDHAHLVFVAPVETECMGPMNALRARMVRVWRERDQVLEDAPFWSRGMKSRLLADRDDLRAHLDFVHYDPVRHGLCERAFDYPWSSLPARVEQGHYPEDWALLGPPASLSRLARSADPAHV
jgi:putative transposase